MPHDTCVTVFSLIAPAPSKMNRLGLEALHQTMILPVFFSSRIRIRAIYRLTHNPTSPQPCPSSYHFLRSG